MITKRINLNNDYNVVAMANWEKESKKYTIYLYLCEKSVGTLEPIETSEKIELESDLKSIRRDMFYYVIHLHKKGFFNQYIDRYEYNLKCFDKGNDFFETQRLEKEGLLNEKIS